MVNKKVSYTYKNQGFMEESHVAAMRVFNDLCEDELLCFASLPKHSPNGKKKYLASNRNDLYPSIGGSAYEKQTKKAVEFRPGWFIPPNIGPKTLRRIFELLHKCRILEIGKDIAIVG
jgi:hypothetical protein